MTRRSGAWLSAGIVVAATFVAPRAFAQAEGFAVNRFDASERGSSWFSQDSLDIRGNLRPAIGAVGDYGYKPLVVYAPDGTERSTIVRHQFFVNLGGTLVLVDRLRFGVNLPVALYQDGEANVVDGTTYRPADKPAIGDLRLQGDVRIVGTTTDPATLAVGVRVFLPTGAASQYAGDGQVRLGPHATLAGEIGYFTYSTRLGLLYRSRDDGFGGGALGSELVFGAAAGVRVVDRKLVVGPELYGSSALSDGFSLRGTPVDWLMGAHYDVVSGLRVGAGIGSGLTRGFGSPRVRALFSVEYAPGFEAPRKDRDGDGISDGEDACPDEPGVRDADPKKNGCPVRDRDKDTIPDGEDACPDVPGVRDADPTKNGCPSDRDRDAIVDGEDACPDVPGAKNDDPKKNGCPPDRDGDAIADVEDACPDVPGVKDPDPKKNGCPPPPPDTDGDGILDADDACPKDPGPRNADPKKNGCPLAIVTDKEVKIFEQVKFKFNSADLLKESDEILGAVKKILEAHPELKKMRIEGHTDNKGNAAYNKQLSKRRAASVMKWMLDHGMEKGRLASEGFGADEPIDTNDTEAGRQNNRRVQFTILERDAPKMDAPKP